MECPIKGLREHHVTPAFSRRRGPLLQLMEVMNGIMSPSWMAVESSFGMREHSFFDSDKNYSKAMLFVWQYYAVTLLTVVLYYLIRGNFYSQGIFRLLIY